eukprot:403333368
MESSAQELNIRDMCALCKSLPCCPEHCCDWDSCQCNHCKSRKSNVHKDSGIGIISQNTDPSILFKSTGAEEIKKIKKQKAKKDQQVDESQKDKELHLPSEQVRASDGALIINYEVAIEEEEDKVVYSGGVRGIRALRQQRDQLNHQIEDDLEEQQRNKFMKYEQDRINSQFEESKR